MDFLDWRARFQRIKLTPSGELPEQTDELSLDEQSAVLSWVASLWEIVSFVSDHSGSRVRGFTVPTGAQTWLAFKRWMLSHHLFIPLLSLIAHCLDECVQKMEFDSRSDVLHWVELAARMRRGCGALFLYGIDFQPCPAIYCGQIRRQMPSGFTGFEIKERHYVLEPSASAFYQAFPKASGDHFIEEVRTVWDAAELLYHERHNKCMVLAVPLAQGQERPESLRQKYMRESGKAHPISEQDFEAYDVWFGIDRSPEVSRLDFVYQLSDIVERILADLLVGHRLEAAVVADLLDSMRAVLLVFSHWAGPLSPVSPFHHCSLVLE